MHSLPAEETLLLRINHITRDICFTADISPTQMGFAFYSSFFSGGVEVQQEEWVHLCLWYDHSRSSRRLFVRGQSLLEEHFTAPRPLFLNGTLVVGT